MSYELSELKNIRKKLGLTQKELAAKAGVSQSMIAKIESGRLDPGYTKTKQIFDAIENATTDVAVLAKDIMNKQVLTVQESDHIPDVIKVMKKHGISQLPVMKGSKVVGKVSERILLEHFGADMKRKRISDIMDQAPPIISGNTRSDAIIALLKYFSMIIVTDKGELKGVITKADVLEKLYG